MLQPPALAVRTSSPSWHKSTPGMLSILRLWGKSSAQGAVGTTASLSYGIDTGNLKSLSCWSDGSLSNAVLAVTKGDIQDSCWGSPVLLKFFRNAKCEDHR